MKRLIAMFMAAATLFSATSALATTPVVGADKIDGVASDAEMKDYMKNTVALYIGQNKIARNGEISILDNEDESVVPYIENDRTLVPIRFVSEALGYVVKYDHPTRSAIIYNDEHEIVFETDKTTYKLDGVEKALDVAPCNTKDRIFVPIRAVAEGFGKKVTYDKCGLIVIADREDFFNLQDDLDVFRKLCGELVFAPPSGAEMVAMLKENYPDNGHPRLYLNDAKIADIKAGIDSNELMADWYGDVIRTADGLLNSEPLIHELPDGVRLLSVSRAAKLRIENLAFAYLMTGNTEYAQKAYEEMANVCSFPDWNPRHHLDTAEMQAAVALGYDWLYDFMTAEQRAEIRNGLIKLGINQTMQDYTNTPGRERSYTWAQATAPDNWNIICNGSVMIAALAIADEEEELAATVFDYGMGHIQRAILCYAPDGAWYEGTGYWEYTTDYYLNFMASLDSVYGDTFGYMDTPGVSETGYYINAMTAANGMFNFHNASSGKISSSNIFFLADKCNDSALAALRTEQMKKDDTPGAVRDLIWYDYKNIGSASNLPLDFYYRDTEVSAMRSGWGDESSIYVGVHAGKINVNHGHMDAGQFIIDAYGTRYAMDLGAENYNIKDNLWNLYRNRAEGHNVIVLNPSTDGGQSLDGVTKVDKFESNASSSMSVIDTTTAYQDNATSAKRGIKLTNNRSMIIIQDEIKAKAPSELYWFMHTQCEVEVAEDGKSAVVKGQYRDMHVYLLEDVPGTFSVMDAAPLESSPKNDEQSVNKGIRKLAFHVENVTDMTLAIACVFDAPGVEIDEYYRPEVVALDNWTPDVSEISEMPKLTDLTINGETVEGFSPDTVGYTYRIRAYEDIPVIDGTGTGDVEIKMPEEVPGTAIITVRAKENSSIKVSYVLTLKKEILSEGPEGTKPVSIANVEASSVPQPQNGPWNSIDGSIGTRWSAHGDSFIVYDMETVKEISHIGLAVYQDTNSNDGRRQFFEVWVSEDGENYTQVLVDETSGTTLESEIFEIEKSNCRFIKIQCNGTSVGEWNSITEFSAYEVVK